MAMTKKELLLGLGVGISGLISPTVGVVVGSIAIVLITLEFKTKRKQN
ncbi:hypothetical protein UT300012_23680 [Paraclostridium bifermentans]